MDIDGDLLLAHRLVDAADEIALLRSGSPGRLGRKPDGSPVSAADLAVERAMLTILGRERPTDGVLTEETGAVRAGADRRWILDPIDGTVAYLAGGRAWGTHVALEVDGELTLAVLSRPTEGIRWWAVRGAGAYRSSTDDVLSTGHRLRVSTTSSLRHARVGGLVEPGSPVVAAVSAVATWADDEVSVIGALLEGRLDAVLDDAGDIWDLAPAVLLVTEAGGRFRDPAGGSRPGLGGGLYSNPRLEPHLVALLDATGTAAGAVPGGGSRRC